MQDQGYYYYEYATPQIESTSRGSKIDPDDFVVHLSGFVYSVNEHVADKEIKKRITNSFPAYDEYDFGYMMFTRLCDADKTREEAQKKALRESFSDDDWKERLRREKSTEKITISKEELDDMGYEF